MIDWNNINGADIDTINEITKRAVKADPSFDTMCLNMDIIAAHIDSPLKLSELLEADEFNFAHDVYGINRHIDRETGEMNNCFLPRYTA